MIQANTGPSQEIDTRAIRAWVRPMRSVIAKGLQVTSGIAVRKPSTQAWYWDMTLGWDRWRITKAILGLSGHPAAPGVLIKA